MTGETCAGFLGLRAHRGEPLAGTPCRSPLPAWQARPLEDHQNSFVSDVPPSLLPKSGAPSTDGSHPDQSRWRLTDISGPPLITYGLATVRQLPTRVHDWISHSLDPLVLRYSRRTPGPRASHRLLQLKQFPNTPTCSPNLGARASSRSKCPALLRAPNSRDASAQGPPLYREENDNCHGDRFALAAFTPT